MKKDILDVDYDVRAGLAITMLDKSLGERALKIKAHLG
jgi:hypothetical protein